MPLVVLIWLVAFATPPPTLSPAYPSLSDGAFVVHDNRDPYVLYLCGALDVTAKHPRFLSFEFRTRHAVQASDGYLLPDSGSVVPRTEPADVMCFDDRVYRVSPVASRLPLTPALADTINSFSEVPKAGRILVCTEPENFHTLTFHCYNLAGLERWRFSVPEEDGWTDSADTLVWIDDRYFALVFNGRWGSEYTVYDCRRRRLVLSGSVKGWVRIVGGKVYTLAEHTRAVFDAEHTPHRRFRRLRQAG